jgi:hypothetical protein
MRKCGEIGIFETAWIIIQKIIDTDHVMTQSEHFFREMGADKPGNARDQTLHSHSYLSAKRLS